MGDRYLISIDMTDQSFVVQEDWLETPRLRVTVFTEAPTEGLTWHEGYSDPYLVVNFRAQLQTFEAAADGASGYKGLVVPGDFSFLPPNTPFGGYYKGTYMSYACITFPTETVNPRFADGKPIIMHSDPLIRGFAEALYAQPHRHDPDIVLYRESITEALIQHLQLLYLEPLSGEKQPRFARLSSYVQAHLNQKLTVAELATMVNTNPQALQRMVQKQFGQSVYEWITTLRLERSLELLCHTNKNLATIAVETGFANQAHWTRLFRKKFGVTPGKVRQN